MYVFEIYFFYFCKRVIQNNGKAQQAKEVRSFLHRYPLLYSSSSKIYYSIDYSHISCFTKHIWLYQLTHIAVLTHTYSRVKLHI